MIWRHVHLMNSRKQAALEHEAEHTQSIQALYESRSARSELNCLNH